MCENNLSRKRQAARILTHELIHAYDVCTKKYDPNNMAHLACSEVIFFFIRNTKGEMVMRNAGVGGGQVLSLRDVLLQ